MKYNKIYRYNSKIYQKKNGKMELLKPIRDLEEEKEGKVDLKIYKTVSERIYKLIKRKKIV